MTTMHHTLLAQGLTLGVLLVMIATIDARHMIIPNVLNLALAATGIAFRLPLGIGSVGGQIAFATAVFVLGYAIRYAHFQMTGRVGLGLGDVKMISAAACWIAPLLLPMLLFMASAGALTAVACLALAGLAVDRNKRVPFGPFIAFGLAGTWAFEKFSGIDVGS